MDSHSELQANKEYLVSPLLVVCCRVVIFIYFYSGRAEGCVSVCCCFETGSLCSSG